MNVLITMAGRSGRFKRAGYSEPKFMLPLGDVLIIEKLVSCFAAEDHFHFILSEEQVAKDVELVSFIQSVTKIGTVHVIPSHDLGPAYSVLQILKDLGEGPLMITYCDFLVEWNYKKFLSFASGKDCVIPTFSGFHPASFGETLFAYIRQNSSNRLLELREKKCFTINRIDEPASVGIYYFQCSKVFETYAREVLNDENRDLPEAYVSLLANPMVRDGYDVYTFPVQKFICLGTPRDYQEYLYWHKVIKSSPPRTAINNLEPLGDVNLVPMAGSGARFRKAGFKTPKPLLTYRGVPLIVHATQSLPIARRNIYVCRIREFLADRIKQNLSSYVDNLTIVNLEKPTAGQLDTCLLASQHINDDDSVFIVSCDYTVTYDVSDWKKKVASDDCDVAIWVNKLGAMPIKRYEAFGYCEIDASNRVKRVVEKRLLSEQPWADAMIVGSFWFRNWRIFEMLGEIVKERGSFDPATENFIGVNINFLIELGYRVHCFWVDEWISFGDPHEYEMLNYWTDYFDAHYA